MKFLAKVRSCSYSRNSRKSTDRKCTPKNSTQEIACNTNKKRDGPPLKLTGYLFIHQICQFPQQNAKEGGLRKRIAKN